MSKFDRYVLGQLLTLFGFFSLILVTVYWINRAVRLFDQLIANGQSATVFFEFSLLTLPNVIRIVLPLAGFAATVFVTNRLTQESELVVAAATGFSPWRMARPVLVYGLIVGAMVAVLTHLLVPLSLTELNSRQREIASSLTARIVNEGTFLHPAPGYTFYVREIDPEGGLHDIFLSDLSNPRQQVTYSALSAEIRAGDDGSLQLFMIEGAAQVLDATTQKLSVTDFVDFSFDLTAMVANREVGSRSIKELTTGELLRASPELLAETKARPGDLAWELVSRSSQASLAVIAALLGFAPLLLGGFSRFGLRRQIFLAVLLIIIVKSIDNAIARSVIADAAAWPLAFVPSLIGLGLVAALLWLGSGWRFHRFRRVAS